MVKNKYRFWILSFLIVISSHYGYSQQAVKYEITGKYVTDNGEKLIVKSSILEESREIYIGLPANYGDSNKYPVVFVLEGEVLFETFAPLTRLMADVEEIPECIVVGIPFYNKHLEYAPKIKSVPESGNVDKMLRFYEFELFPLLDSLYNGTGDRIIWAHSGLGGIFCTYLLLGPDTQFNAILSSSPSLKWMGQYIENDQVFEEVSKKGSIFYYLTFGGAESEVYMGKMYENVKQFKQLLESKAPKNLKWMFDLNENNNHFTNAIETYMEGLKLYFSSVKEVNR